MTMKTLDDWAPARGLTSQKPSGAADAESSPVDVSDGSKDKNRLPASIWIYDAQSDIVYISVTTHTQ